MDVQSPNQPGHNANGSDQVRVKTEHSSPEQNRTLEQKRGRENMDVGEQSPSERPPSPEHEQTSHPPTNQAFVLVPVVERRSPSPAESSEPDRSFSITPEAEQRSPPIFSLYPPTTGLQLAETPLYDGTPAAPPPDTPARFLVPSPLPVPPSGRTPRPSSELMQALQGSQNQIQVKTEESPAETLRASDNTPTSSESSTSTQSGFGQSNSASGHQQHNFQPGPSTRRTTRGSLAAAAATTSSSGDSHPIVKRSTPEPGDPVQASINCWIITKVKDWVLPPPKMGVSLAQVVPPDVTVQPWMKFTRHPILWDQKTDAGGKSGKKLVTIGAAAIKKSVNGKLPGASGQKDDTFDGLHLLMDFDPDQKPSYSYALITRFAILGSPYKSLSLGEIYMMLEAKFPYFAKDESKWRDSIRYNLSSNNWFVKTKRALHQPGIGNLWKVDEESPGGPKRPRKGRNRGTAFTDVDDDGDEGSPDEAGEIASTSTRNGTLMLTFDSKQKVPLDKDAGQRTSTGHANHNLISRVASRPPAAGHSRKTPSEEYSLSTVDPYAEAAESRFIGAANAAIEKTRETAEMQRRAPKNTPAPPWMSSAEIEAEDSGIGSGRDDESGGGGSEEDDIQGTKEMNRREDGMYEGPEDVQMEEDTPSPPSPNSASSPPTSTHHPVYNSAAARHVAATSAGVFSQARSMQESRKPVAIVQARPFTQTPDVAAPGISAPTFSSLWSKGASTSADKPSTSTAAGVSGSQSRPAHQPSSSSTSTAASADINSRASPDPQNWGQSIFPGQNQRRDIPGFKPIAPTASSSGPGARATLASSMLSPYTVTRDNRKRKNAQTSPGRSGMLSAEERRTKTRKIESNPPGRETQRGPRSIFTPASQSPLESTQAVKGSRLVVVPAERRSSTTAVPPTSATSSSRSKHPTELSAASARPGGHILGNTFPTSSIQANMSAMFQSALSARDPHGLLIRSGRSFSGPASSSTPRTMGMHRNSIDYDTHRPHGHPPSGQRNFNPGSNLARSRRTSGNMDVDRNPRPFDGYDSDSYERPSPNTNNDMELDGSDEEVQRGRLPIPGQTGIPRRFPGGRLPPSGSIFGQAQARVGSSLSIAVPVSSSRTERGPPTPRDEMISSPTSASHSPTVANLVSPTGSISHSSRLPPITSLLGNNLSSESQGPLAPIQNIPSRNSPPAGSSSMLYPSSSSTPHLLRRTSSTIELSIRSPPAVSQPSTFGPPLYYGFIISDTPPVSASPRSSLVYQGGDSDDLAYSRYHTRDWRD